MRNNNKCGLIFSAMINIDKLSYRYRLADEQRLSNLSSVPPTANKSGNNPRRPKVKL